MSIFDSEEHSSDYSYCDCFYESFYNCSASNDSLSNDAEDESVEIMQSIHELIHSFSQFHKSHYPEVTSDDSLATTADVGDVREVRRLLGH